MKKFIVIIAVSLFCLDGFAQQKNNDDAAIQKVMQTFMNCLAKKDSVAFYNLFYDGPVAWVGVYNGRTQLERLKENNTLAGYFTGNYKRFYRIISPVGADEEKFENVIINNDESIAGIIFDYSFLTDGKRTNWGKESWGLVKINNTWKITSVIFSMELEKYYPKSK